MYVHRPTGHVYSLSNRYTLKCLGVSARLGVLVQILTGGVCVLLLLDICTLQAVVKPGSVKPGSVWGVCFTGTTVPIFKVSGVSACLVGCTRTQAN